MPTIVVYITCKSSAQAKRISSALLKAKLIACANMFPIQSMYRWKSKMMRDREVVLIGKTQAKHYAAIVKKVTALHSYRVPCIGKFSISYNAPYAKWLIKKTTK